LDGTFATGFALAVIDVRSDELGLVLEHQIVAQPELEGHRPGIARGLRIRLAPDPLSSLRNTFTATGPKPLDSLSLSSKSFGLEVRSWIWSTSPPYFSKRSLTLSRMFVAVKKSYLT